jgi:energy-converting hydrogenase Eha subunit E
MDFYNLELSNTNVSFLFFLFNEVLQLTCIWIHLQCSLFIA